MNKGICLVVLTDPLNLLIAKLFKCFSNNSSCYHAIGTYNKDEIRLVQIYQSTPIPWIKTAADLMKYAVKITYCETEQNLEFLTKSYEQLLLMLLTNVEEYNFNGIDLIVDGHTDKEVLNLANLEAQKLMTCFGNLFVNNLEFQQHILNHRNNSHILTKYIVNDRDSWLKLGELLRVEDFKIIDYQQLVNIYNVNDNLPKLVNKDIKMVISVDDNILTRLSDLNNYTKAQLIDVLVYIESLRDSSGLSDSRFAQLQNEIVTKLTKLIQ